MRPRMQTHHASDVNMYEALRKRFLVKAWYLALRKLSYP